MTGNGQRFEPVIYKFDDCQFELQPSEYGYEYLFFKSKDGRHARVPLAAIKYVSYVQSSNVATITDDGVEHNWHYSLTLSGDHSVLAELNFRANDNGQVNELQDKIVELHQQILVV